MKNTKVNDREITDLFQHYEVDSTEQFRQYCITVVSNARVPNPDIIRRMSAMTKDQLVKCVTNFAFKGHGLGVI